MVREADAAAGIQEGQIHDLERTLESLREDSEVAHVLLSLSGVLAEIRSVEETLDKAVKVVAEIMRADHAFAVTVRDDGNGFQLRAHTGYDPDGVTLLRDLATDPQGLSLLRAALDERQPVLIADTGADPRVDSGVAERRRV
ncbi:MAG: GAF domain-containing protein, partial [Actinomycetota bacterium]|nr:GAF domain-containing protein [Actinomycetota bacterium]